MAAGDRSKWTPELVESFITLRLQHEWLFTKKKRPWKDFHKILMERGFPPLPMGCIRKKWSNINDHYRMAIARNNKQWLYYDIFDKHKNEFSDVETHWSNEWIIKLIQARTNTESLFLNTYSSCTAGWDEVERQLRISGLPNQYSVKGLDEMWLNLIKEFRMIYKYRNDDTSTDSIWPFYKYMKVYFDLKPDELAKMKRWRDKMKGKNSSSDDGEDDDMDSSDDEPLIHIKNATLKPDESKHRDSVWNEDDDEDFTWTSEWTESFIRIRLEHESLFKTKKRAWKEFHTILLANGFPKSVTRGQIRRKWSLLILEYKKAVSKNNTKWIYFSTFQKYLSSHKFDTPLKNWSEEWIKELISLRLRNNHIFDQDKIDIDACWANIEKQLRTRGLPSNYSVRNVHLIWSSLVKTFKRKHANFDDKKTRIWPYYYEMKNFFFRCEPQVLESYYPGKKSTNSGDDTKPDIEEEKPHIVDELKLNVISSENPYMTYKCRTCLATSESLRPLFESDDNIASMLMTCTSIQLSKNDNLPKYICQLCFEELLSAFKFREKCEATEKILKTTLKQEIHDVKDYMYDVSVDNRLDDSQDNPFGGNDSDSEYRNLINDSEPLVNCKVELENRSLNKGSKVKKKRRNRSSNIVMVPIVSQSGETTFKRKYVYWKVCEICGKSSQRMAEHMKVHSGDKGHKCPKCPKTFTYRASLLTHVKTHNDTPLKVCQICGRQFYRNLTYRRHLIIHANERKFSCDDCGKTFNTKDILKIHMRSHTGIRPYSCKICGKSFISSGCVSRHQKTHRKILSGK